MAGDCFFPKTQQKFPSRSDRMTASPCTRTDQYLKRRPGNNLSLMFRRSHSAGTGTLSKRSQRYTYRKTRPTPALTTTDAVTSLASLCLIYMAGFEVCLVHPSAPHVPRPHICRPEPSRFALGRGGGRRTLHHQHYQWVPGAQGHDHYGSKWTRWSYQLAGEEVRDQRCATRVGRPQVALGRYIQLVRRLYFHPRLRAGKTNRQFILENENGTGGTRRTI